MPKWRPQPRPDVGVGTPPNTAATTDNLHCPPPPTEFTLSDNFDGPNLRLVGRFRAAHPQRTPCAGSATPEPTGWAAGEVPPPGKINVFQLADSRRCHCAGTPNNREDDVVRHDQQC
jgi:hypothetical protein